MESNYYKGAWHKENNYIYVLVAVIIIIITTHRNVTLM